MQTAQNRTRDETKTIALLQKAGSQSCENNLVEKFDSDMQISDDMNVQKSEVPDASGRTKFVSAKMKRKSFASQKPLARVSLIKSTMSFDRGQKSILEEVAAADECQTINRRAAFRRLSNLTRGVIPEHVRISQFARESSSEEVPGHFSPRNSLKRQRSVSADSLADIRSHHNNPTKESDNNNCKKDLSENLGYSDDLVALKEVGFKLTEQASGISMSNPEISKIFSSSWDMDSKMDSFVVKTDKSVKNAPVIENFSSFGKYDTTNPVDHASSNVDCAISVPALGSKIKNEKANSLEQDTGLFMWDRDVKDTEGEDKKNLGRTVSDSVTITQPSHHRLVKFASDVGQAQGCKKLQRTPTPYWAQSCDQDSCDHDNEENEKSFDSASSLDLPKFL